ncbi:hypothetical protein VaNZ11_006515 [Volvox africanus]|uniref:Uncharacterized protein n=1 Tax=Volvox africanus TaxID=51714 RepID=A0ABQ5S1A8_9CHLO|nr:hypothetical protein VaNZ11_006515 [Volvox africanus]
MEQQENVFASLMGQARFLGGQAREWAQKNKPTTITGCLAFTAASGVASAAIAIGLIISIILVFFLLTSLLGAAFVLGITIVFWLCVSAWMFLAFSAIAASLAAWLVIGQLGLGLLRAAYNSHWLPWQVRVEFSDRRSRGFHPGGPVGVSRSGSSEASCTARSEARKVSFEIQDRHLP